MTVWDTFFMMLMVIPVSKMLSSIFMKLIARIGTIDEEKYAMMGMGTIMTIAAVAGVGKKNKLDKLGKSGSGDRTGDRSGGDGLSGGSGSSPSSATLDFLGASPGAGTGSIGGADAVLGRTGARDAISSLDGSPLDDISQKAGKIADKAGAIGAYAGAISPVAAPVVAGVMGFTTRAMTGIPVAAKNVAGSLKKGYKGHRADDMGRAGALAQSAMDLTGANNPSEASARILGSVLGSTFGADGSKFGANVLGGTASRINKASGWAKDRFTKPS